jgi:branched-chain amino acid transport system permease protein
MNLRSLGIAVIVVVVLLLLPLVFHGNYLRHLFILAFLFAIVASSWDLTLGYTGLFNFGHIAFFGLGVYSAGILTTAAGVNPWLTLPAGGIVAALAALLVAAPTLRLRGIYVVLVTFAFSQLCLQIVLSQSDITGGAGGIVSVPGLRLGAHNFARDQRLGYYYVSLILCVASVLILLAIARSTFGKTARAIRDNPEYAAARGIDQTRIRLAMLMISAVPSGIAGALYCLYFRVAAPEVFSFSTSTLILTMLLVGGASSVIGPAAAAIGIVMVSEYLEQFPELQATKHILLAIGIILVLRFFPGGLVQIFSHLALPKPRQH